MYGLSKEEKIKFIVEKSEELGITAYEYGEKTELTSTGARNILKGESPNARTKNLNIMIQYLESKVVGTAIGQVNENTGNYKKEDSPKENEQIKRLETKIDKLTGMVATLLLDIDDLPEKIKNKSIGG
jgi:hypothetical protein